MSFRRSGRLPKHHAACSCAMASPELARIPAPPDLDLELGVVEKMRTHIIYHRSCCCCSCETHCRLQQPPHTPRTTASIRAACEPEYDNLAVRFLELVFSLPPPALDRPPTKHINGGHSRSEAPGAHSANIRVIPCSCRQYHRRGSYSTRDEHQHAVCIFGQMPSLDTAEDPPLDC